MDRYGQIQLRDTSSKTTERDFPTIKQVLSAFRQANCHGRVFLHARGPNASMDLPPCPDPAACAESDGLHLGEIGLQVDDRARRNGANPLWTNWSRTLP